MARGTQAPKKAENLPALPADWFEEMGREAVDAQARLPTPSSRVISIRGGKFSLNDQLLQAPLEVVIVDFALERAYYPGAFDENHIVPPDCWALSYGNDDEKGMAPPADLPNRQHETCFGCPMDAWGSAGRGSRRKACNSNIRTALLEADVDDINAAQLAFLKLPVMSATNFVNYVREIANNSHSKAAYFGVKTAIDFDTKAKYPLVTFKVIEPIKDGRLAELVLAQRRVVKEQLMRPFGAQTEEEEEQTPAQRVSNAKPVKRKFGK